MMQGETDLASKYESSIWLRPLGNHLYQIQDVPYPIAAEKYFEAGDFRLAQQYAAAAAELADLGERNWWSRRLAHFSIELEDYKTAARASRIFAVNLLMAGSTIQRNQSIPYSFFSTTLGRSCYVRLPSTFKRDVSKRR